MPLVNKVADALPSSMIRKLYYSKVGKSLVKIYDRANKENDKTVICSLANGALMEVYPKLAGERAIIHGAFEPPVTRYFLSLLKSDDIVLDIGSWIGYYSMLAAKRAKRVVAIDIDAANLERVKKNSALNGFSNIDVLRVGISDTTAKGTVNEDKSASMRKLEVGSGDLMVDTLDNVVSTMGISNIGVVIMDIEGHEVFALQGMKGLLAEKRIRDLIIEVHPNFIAKSGYTDRDVLKMLGKFDYAVETIHRESGSTFNIHATQSQK